MGVLSDDLQNMGYETTDKESPFHDDGILWTNGTELVCDETGAVIRGNDNAEYTRENEKRQYHEYPNSERIRMNGGYFSKYDWGYDEDDRFRY